MKDRAIKEAFIDRIDHVLTNDKTLYEYLEDRALEGTSYDCDDTDYIEEATFDHYYNCIFDEIKLEGLEKFLNLSPFKFKARIYEIINNF